MFGRPQPRPERRRADRRSRGQSLVEMALVLPVLLVLLAAALDLGRVFYSTITLNNAAREGAMAAADAPGSYQAGQPCDTTTNLVICRVQLEAKGSAVAIQPTDISLDCSIPGCPAQAGSTVTVGVSGTFNLLTPLLSGIFGGTTIDLSSSATAQVAYLPAFTAATPPPVPSVAFTAVNVTGPAPLTVTFTDQSTGSPIAWVWDFGDGNTSNEQNPVHTYTTDGSYDVTLTVVNSADSSSLTKTGYIVVDPATPTPTPTGTATPTPTPSPSPSSSPGCSNPPNIIGETPGNATILLGNAGFTPEGFGDLTTGQKDKVQSQNPDHTQCLPAGTTVTFHYRPS
jgi:Flp pilus assembly protein TadG